MHSPESEFGTYEQWDAHFWKWLNEHSAEWERALLALPGKGWNKPRKQTNQAPRGRRRRQQEREMQR